MKPGNQQKKSGIHIDKVYTKSGDLGLTSLVGGQRLPKSHPRIEAYGTVDELNCFVGRSLETSKKDLQSVQLEDILGRIQYELFNMGSMLATLPEDLHSQQRGIELVHISRLEKDIDFFNQGLSPLKSFVLPGGSVLAADLHVCRTVARRAERLIQPLVEQGEIPKLIMIYLNRLSDAFFVFSRWVLKEAQQGERFWDPQSDLK